MAASFGNITIVVGWTLPQKKNADKILEDGTLQRASENISTTLVTWLNLKNMIKESENLIKAKSWKVSRICLLGVA